jgi:glycosyltransferase involved in cell wall biosynthesis
MIERLSILHLGKFYPPHYGGIESVTATLAEDQIASGHRVEVVCFTCEPPEFDRQEAGPTIRRFHAKRVVASQPLSWGYVMAGLRGIGRADVIHVHLPNLLAALVAAIAPRRARVVLHWHADIEGKGLLGMLVRPIEWFALARADAVICTSPNYLRSSVALRSWQHKAHVIPIGIADVQMRDGRRSADPFVLFVGRLVPYKGVSVLLQAVAQMKSDARLMIVGRGPMQASLMDEAESLGIASRVAFLGAVEDETLARLFNEARIFCLPSINRLEAFGVVLLEAMRAGCPTVAADIPGSGVGWVNSEGLSVPVTDAAALARQIDRVLSEPALAEELSARARARFVGQFTRATMSARMIKLYRTLL